MSTNPHSSIQMLFSASLEDLATQAWQVNVLDGWTRAGDAVYFELGTIIVKVNEKSAHSFVAGLLRVYERATALELRTLR